MYLLDANILIDAKNWFAPGLMEGKKLEKETFTCPSSTPRSSSSVL